MNTPLTLPSFVALTVLSGALLTGCAAPAPPVDISSACASVSTTTTPPTCERPYDTGVAVRLPETTSGAVGAVARGGEEFTTSTGARLKMSDTVRDRVLEGNAYASSIYQAQVADGTVTSVTPVATLMSADPLSATWEVDQHGNPVSGPGLVLQRASVTVDTGRSCS